MKKKSATVVVGREMTEKEAARLEAFRGIRDGKLSKSEAASMLGILPRQVRRMYARWQFEGDEGVKSRRFGREPGNKKVLERAAFVEWYSEKGAKAAGYGPELARDEYADETGVSHNSMFAVRALSEAGHHVQRKEKPLRQHPLRDRMPRYGDAVLIDATPHEWMPGFTCNLIQAVDDATSALLGAMFVETESLFSYLRFLEGYVLWHGRPVRLVTDKHAVFRHSGGDQEGHRTRFVLVLDGLEIEIWHTSSPESRGRVERAHWTAQMRLTKLFIRHLFPMLRDRLDDRAHVMSVMNAFLRERYIESYNRKFAIAPLEAGDSHRPLTADQRKALPLLMCRVTEVRMDKNGMVRYGNVFYKTEKPGAINTYARRQRPLIAIHHRHDGTIRFFHHSREIEMVETAQAVKKEIPILTAKDINEARRAPEPPNPVKTHSHSPDHPWKKASYEQMMTKKNSRKDAK